MSSTDFTAPTTCKAYGVTKAGEKVHSFEITRRALSPEDVAIKIKYSGICHSDIHKARGEWGGEMFPMVPGHEIVGEVVAVGSNVTKHTVGQLVGVGCMIDSCRECVPCKSKSEQYCAKGCVMTYDAKAKFSHMAEHNDDGGAVTMGGYAENIVVNEDFVLKMPTNLDPAAAAPLLCAGVTVWSPFIHHGLKAGMKLGIVGLGGLGHIGVKIANAMGAEVTVISRGTAKKEEAISKLGAKSYIDSKNEEEMAAAAFQFDMILCTIAAAYDVTPYLNMLKMDGKMIVVGAPDKPCTINLGVLIFARRCVAGSLIGSIQETQDMLDFCGKHNVVCDIEMTDASKINEAYERVLASDVRYRAVIDASTF